MNQRMSLIAAAAAAVIWASPAFAQRVNSHAGTSSAQFLKIGVGARPIGMGEAFTAAADDVNAVYWNPAGLAGQKAPAIGVSHNALFQGLNHEFAGFVLPCKDGCREGTAWGFGFTTLTYPNDIERRSGQNESDIFNPLTAPQGTFGANDLALGASFARHWTEHQSLGATLKYIRQTIESQSGQTGAVDLGWRCREAAPGLDLGAVVQNLGPGLAVAGSYPLPLTFKFGASYLAKASLWALDVSFPRDDYPSLAAGAEIPMGQLFFLRTGYRYRWYGDPLGVVSGFRAGVGFALDSFTLDYAFTPFGDLGNAHRISVGWRFGSGISSPITGARLVPTAHRTHAAVFDRAGMRTAGGAVEAGGRASLPPSGNALAAGAGQTVHKTAAPAARAAESARPASSSGGENHETAETGGVASADTMQSATHRQPSPAPPREEESILPAAARAYSRAAPVRPPAAVQLPVQRQSPETAIEDGFTPFRVLATPKVVSARGTDYLVQANAPSSDWELKRVQFRSLMPTSSGLSMQAWRGAPPTPLPSGYSVMNAYRIHFNGAIAPRSVSLEFSPSATKPGIVSVFAVLDGEWKPLLVREATRGNKVLIEAHCDRLPEVVAIATSTAPSDPGR